MRKAVNVLLIFVLIFTLAACGGANKVSEETATNNSETNSETNTETAVTEEIVPEEGAELVVWESEGPENTFIEFVAQEFEKKYGVPVRTESVGIIDAPDRLMVDGPAGLAADVFAIPHDRLGSLVEQDLVLENLWPDEYAGAFMDAAVTGTTFNDTLYGYPTAIETYALFYNKNLVDTPPATMDELIEVSKGLTNTSEQKYGFMMEVANFYFAYGFLGGYGSYVFGDNNSNPEDIGLNNEGAAKAGQLLQRIKSEILPLNSGDITYDIKNALFSEGKLAFDLNGPWAVQGYKDANVNFGVAPLPALDNGEYPTSFSGIRGLYVNSYSDFPNAASLFAKFATSEEMLVKRFEMTRQLPPRTALIEDPTITEDPISAAFLTQAQYAVAMPNIPEMAQVWAPMAAALDAIWNNGTDPKQAFDDAVAQIKANIK